MCIRDRNLANTLREQGDRDGARALQETVTETYERTLPEDHPDLLRMRMNLAAALYLDGERTRARELAVELGRGTLKRLVWAASSLSRREARAVVGQGRHRYSVVRFLTASAEPGARDPLSFELVETMRDVLGLDLATGIEADPEILRLRAAVASARGSLGDLATLELPDERASASVAGRVVALGSERDAIERELHAKLVARGAYTGTIRAAEVARGLPPGAVAIGYYRTRGWRPVAGTDHIEYRGDVLGAHAVRSDGSVVEHEIGPIDELEALARAWRAQVEAGDSGPEDGPEGPASRGGEGAGPEPDAQAADLGHVLRERLLDPFLTGPEEPSVVFVCPADLVHAIPLDALPLGTGVVGDRHAVVNEVSLRRFVAPPGALAEDAEPELLAVGGVGFDVEGEAPSLSRVVTSAQIERGGADRSAARAFRELPGTREEVQSVRSLFEEAFEGVPTVLMGGAATKAALHRLALGKRYLHVATHGWFEEMDDPVPPVTDSPWAPLDANVTVTGFTPMSLCGLALAGANRGRDSLGRVPGILTAEELAGIDLSACELAVLSACETNVGLRSAGLGIQSLQSALHTAGVRTAITSLWKVDDDATRILMERFYAYLWVDRLPKAEALWRAKGDLRAEGHPRRDWAAWVLSGDPD